MKNFNELRRNSKVKWKPYKKKYKHPPASIKVKERPICRVLPLIVADNYDKFIEIAKGPVTDPLDIKKYLLES